MLKKSLTALGLLGLIAGSAAAALWPNFPIVGGAAYCTSYTGAAGTTCASTAPAGPTIVTGLETIPADTNLTQGRTPATVKLTLASLNALPVAYRAANVSGLDANNFTSNAAQGGVIFTGAGALSATSVVLPPTPIDGQQFRVTSTQSIATLSVTAPGGATVLNGPSALTVSATLPYGYMFRYRTSNTSWYRVQ